MTEVTARLGRQHGNTAPTSQALAGDLNLPIAGIDPNLVRKPEYYVHLYTVSKREFTISQPPLFPKVVVPACKEGERYTLVCSIPHPMQQLDREGAVGELIVRGHTAEYVAASLVNPNNPSLDQDAVINPQFVLGIGVDLTCQGVFWTRNHPPTEQEIAKAEGRREKYYRGLMERARTLEISNPKELEQLITQDFHMAADYFGEERAWHKKMSRTVECPNCGDSIKAGIAFHRSSAGVLCIIDPSRAPKTSSSSTNE